MPSHDWDRNPGRASLQRASIPVSDPEERERESPGPGVVSRHGYGRRTREYVLEGIGETPRSYRIRGAPVCAACGRPGVELGEYWSVAVLGVSYAICARCAGRPDEFVAIAISRKAQAPAA
jgi:hypothetical protein